MSRRQAPTPFAAVCRRRRSGAVVVYAIVVLIVLLLMATYAVDWGRGQLTKTELQSASDAAARYGVAGLKTSVGQAQAQAIWAGGLNRADGQSVVLAPATDIEFGVWDPAAKSFEVLTGGNRASATAVRVTARRTKASSNPVPVTFGRSLGIGNIDVTTTSIASRGMIVTNTVAAKASPWLAGMPNGSVITPYDDNTTGCTAPTNSPKQVVNVPLEPGGSIFFRQTTGTTSYTDASNYGPDGQTDWIVRQRPANGINATSAPIMSLVGIFLDDRAPNTYAQQPELDFTTEGSRNFKSLSPKIKQVFFIGDGLDNAGNLQEFVVPTGATRFYLGIMDEKGWWWDNTGQIQTTMMDDNIALVK